jgi:hypothetical protein
MAKKITADALRIQKTPLTATIRRRMKLRVGKKFKRGICDFLTSLFEINETLPKSKKMTDMEIARQVCKEYAAHPHIADRYTPEAMDDFNMVTKQRSEYNYGRLSGPPPEPRFVSFPYNEDGLAVNLRHTIPRPLTEKQKEAIRDRVAAARIRYFRKRMEQAEK